MGVTFSPAHKLSADPECKVISVNSTTNVTDTTTYTVNNGLELPMMIGAGLQFNHNNQLKLHLLRHNLQMHNQLRYRLHNLPKHNQLKLNLLKHNQLKFNQQEFL